MARLSAARTAEPDRPPEPSRRPRGASLSPHPASPAASAPRRSFPRRRLRSLGRRVRALALAAIAGLALGVPEAARAQTEETLVSNFGQEVQYVYANIFVGFSRSQALTTGSNPLGYGLTSIQVDCDEIDITPTSLTASIWTANAQGEPPAKQFDLTNPVDLSNAIFAPGNGGSSLKRGVSHPVTTIIDGHAGFETVEVRYVTEL